MMNTRILKRTMLAVLLTALIASAVAVLTASKAYADEGRVIRTSEITDDMLLFRNEKGYLRVQEDCTLVIDSDYTLHGLIIKDGENNSGTCHDLNIRGDNEHTLTILADINAIDAIVADNVTFESGNVEITKYDPVNSIKAMNNFYMKGGKIKADIQRTGWANFSIEGRLVVSGGEITVLDTDAEGQTRGAIECGEFEMTGGTVRGETVYGSGIRVSPYAEGSNGTAEISGGKVYAIGKLHGFDVKGGFEMTGGYAYAKTTSTTSSYPPAFYFGHDPEKPPVIGGNLKISTPAEGQVKYFELYEGSYAVADEDGNVAREVVIQPDFGTAKVSLSTSSYTYNGKVKTPSVTVKVGSIKLVKDTDYTVTYADGRIDPGTYTVKVKGKGLYTNETYILSFRIDKAANPLKVKAKTASVKYRKLLKKPHNFLVKKVINFTNAGKGTRTYVKKGGNSKITINKKTGKVTVKKGLKKGSYIIKVQVKAAGNKYYKAGAKIVAFTIKVK